MKKTGTLSAILVLALAASNFISTRAAGADQSQAEITAILTSGVWRFVGKNWDERRVFNPNGTLSINGTLNETARWRIDAFHVNIIFNDHEEEMTLPLDPKGTYGKDGKGIQFVATLAYVSPQPRPAPAPRVALQTPAPAPAAKPEQNDTTKLLTTGKWHFEGSNWSNLRIFSPDGTLTVERPRKTANWAISGNQIVMTFSDHIDYLTLPLDPKGTKGMDSHGREDTATQVMDETPAATPAAPVAAATPTPSAPTPTPAPAAAQPQDEAMKILEAYVWTLKGKNVLEQLQFLPNGTATVIWQPNPRLNPNGALTWRIDHFHVTVIFPDHEEVLYLPIDPKGTNGKDRQGADFTATADRTIRTP